MEFPKPLTRKWKRKQKGRKEGAKRTWDSCRNGVCGWSLLFANVGGDFIGKKVKL